MLLYNVLVLHTYQGTEGAFECLHLRSMIQIYILATILCLSKWAHLHLLHLILGEWESITSTTKRDREMLTNSDELSSMSLINV